MHSQRIRAGRGANILSACRFLPLPAFWLRRCISVMDIRCCPGGLPCRGWCWSGKEINFSRTHPFQLLFLLAIVFYVMIRYSNVVFFGIGLTYMFSGIFARAAYGGSRRRRKRPAGISVADDVSAQPDSLRPL